MATGVVQTPAPVAQAPVVNIGAANPLRIAELRLGKTLDPAQPGFQDTLAQALGLPFERLFDPKFIVRGAGRRRR